MESVVGSDHLYPARRAEFWQVLLCMGFDPSAACTGAYSGLALEPTVFENGIYHTKAAEVILHFLFTQLDAGRFRREFFGCWPVCDPRQSRDFRTHSFKWLEELKKDTANWPADVPVRRSYVDECRGVRFEEMLWTLAKHTALHLLHGPWRPALKHGVADVPVGERGKLSHQQHEQISKALASCRARYARRTRDRMQAQAAWRRAEQDLRAEIGSAREERDKTRHAFRSMRRVLDSACPGTIVVPGIEASAAEVQQELAKLAEEARGLWAATSGWVDAHRAAIEQADAVVEQRTVPVRLDGARDLRLAPARLWATWLAQNRVQPFLGTSLDLQAMARMAAVGVTALHGHLAIGHSDFRLQGAGTLPLPKVKDDLPRLEAAIHAQGARVARLKRLRGLLGQQRAAIHARVEQAPETAESPMAGVICALERAELGADDSKSNVAAGGGGNRMRRLAEMWDGVAGEEYPLSVLDAAWPTGCRAASSASEPSSSYAGT
ncbi:hypothetical protein EC988_005087, partial [Linderina pennispora]